ncbi:MAG: M42 family peptidase [Clostridia bacterium]|nr:M42 family peptidase [Clostridia bacterium]
MIDLLKKLCLQDGISGDEGTVREFILSEIDGCCEWKIDPLGNIICFKKGKNATDKKVLMDAHMDEVGLVITAVTPDGFLKFTALGMDTAVLTARRVLIEGSVYGVIGGKPIHLTRGEASKKLPPADSLYIDIGAKNRDEALDLVSPGDRAVLTSDWAQAGDKIRCKALDDRVGCAALISLLKQESEYDFYAVFSTQEEVGCRGARVAAFAVDPDFALVLEGTTAADIADVPTEKQVCHLGKGPAVSFMDRSTVYDRDLYEAALASGVLCQPKAAVTGGNNSAAIHLSKEGVRTLAISVPCRYIHSATSVADVNDIEKMPLLAKQMLCDICGGKIQ